MFQFVAGCGSLRVRLLFMNTCFVGIDHCSLLTGKTEMPGRCCRLHEVVVVCALWKCAQLDILQGWH